MCLRFYEAKGYRENYGYMGMRGKVCFNTAGYGFIVFQGTISYSMVFVLGGGAANKKSPHFVSGGRRKLRGKLMLLLNFFSRSLQPVAQRRLGDSQHPGGNGLIALSAFYRLVDQGFSGLGQRGQVFAGGE